MSDLKSSFKVVTSLITKIYNLRAFTMDFILLVFDGNEIFSNGLFKTFFSSTRTVFLRYYDGQLVRTIDDPLQVSRGAGFFILSQGEFFMHKNFEIRKRYQIEIRFIWWWMVR